MGECSISPLTVLETDPGWFSGTESLFCCSGGHVAGMVGPVWQWLSCSSAGRFNGCRLGAWCVFCSPQFSALYPEMVDALVFLDCYGFLPADPVHKHPTIKNESRFVPRFPTTLFRLLSSFRKSCLRWCGRGWRRLFSLTKGLKRRREFTPLKMQWRGADQWRWISSQRGAVKMVLSSFRLLAGNPSISEESVHNILERGLVRVEGGLALSAPVSYWL